LRLQIKQFIKIKNQVQKTTQTLAIACSEDRLKVCWSRKVGLLTGYFGQCSTHLH